MSWTSWAYISALILVVTLVLLAVYLLILLTDLESDYLNPVDLCNKMNMFILPEMGVHAFISLSLLLTGNYLSFLLNLPLLAYNISKIIGNKQFLDATEIFRNLNSEKMEWGIKLGFYLFSLFFYLFKMISVLIEENSSSYQKV